MDIKTFIEEEKRIQNLVGREFVDPTGNTYPIYDGVADLEGYLASSPRIMWILKEPYDDFNENGEPAGGGWSFAKDRPFNSEIDKTSRARVFQPICYINYGIWNAVHDWKSSQMPELLDCPEMRNGLRKIAYVNVSKLPAGKGSPSTRIEEAYHKYRAIILDQIRTYSPELIFACPPHVSLLLKDLGDVESQWKDFGSAASVRISSKQRLVRVAHPSQRSTKRADYVNHAIKAATTDL